jgi:ATP synthase protein I
VIPSNQSLQPPLFTEESVQVDSSLTESVNPMQDYYQLQQTLLLVTLALTGVIAISVWIFASLNIALSYLLGASVGMIYLKMLAREVEQLTFPNQRLGIKGLALFAGLIIVACKWQQLHIIPVFLGFLTYKAAIIVYMVQTAIMPAQK